MEQPITFGQVFKSVPLMLALGGMLVTAGVGWGALKVQVDQSERELDKREGKILALEIKAAVAETLANNNSTRIQALENSGSKDRIRKLENGQAAAAAQFQEIIRRLQRLDNKVDRLSAVPSIRRSLPSP